MRWFLLSLLACSALAQTWVPQASGTTASLRGIGVVDANVAWAGGTEGTFLRTVNGGVTWQAGAVPGAARLDFRGVRAFTANHAMLMSSGPGSASTLYSTLDGGRTWTLAFSNPDAAGFFDALAFDDEKHGAVLGDPVGGSFVVLTTDDGGITWKRLMKLPPALPGEGAFAASNSSLVLRHCAEAAGCEIWFATGGAGGARVFHLQAGNWTVTHTPIRADSAGAGIFALYITPGTGAVAVGGNYEKPGEDAHNVALANSATEQWSEPTGVRPRGYRSAVVFLRDNKLWITTGPSGSEWSTTLGADWIPFEGGYNAIGGDTAAACWAVGPKGRIAKLVMGTLESAGPAKP